MKLWRRNDEPAAAGTPEATFAVGPTRASQWKECIRRLLAADGHVIQGSSEEMLVGSSVRMWGSDLAFKVLGEASYEDALRQWRVWMEISGDDEMEPPAPGMKYCKFGARA